MRWDSMSSWNGQIPENWNGRDLLPDREEVTSDIYRQSPWNGVTTLNKEVICKCGCGTTTPIRNGAPLKYVPGHNARDHWKKLKACS